MEGSVATTQRPFHETILEVLNNLPYETSNEEILRWLQLIKRTAIPKNHDAIDQALRDLGRTMEITVTAPCITDIEALDELARDRKSLQVDLRRTIESVREQKAREGSEGMPLRVHPSSFGH